MTLTCEFWPIRTRCLWEGFFFLSVATWFNSKFLYRPIGIFFGALTMDGFNLATWRCFLSFFWVCLQFVGLFTLSALRMSLRRQHRLLLMRSYQTLPFWFWSFIFYGWVFRGCTLIAFDWFNVTFLSHWCPWVDLGGYFWRGIRYFERSLRWWD